MNNLIKLIPFLTTYPMWVKWVFVAWVVISAILLVSLLFAPHKPNTENKIVTPPKQSLNVSGQENTSVQLNESSVETLVTGKENTAVKIDNVSVEQLIVNNFPKTENPETANYPSPKSKEIQLKLPKDEYDLKITGRSRVDERVITPSESQNFSMDLQQVDSYIKNIKVIKRSTGESTLFDFTSGHLPRGTSFRRISYAHYPEPYECAAKIAKTNEPRFVKINEGEYALYIERGSTNLLLNSTSPQKHYFSLSSGVYTFSFQGTGTVSLINVGKKTGWTISPSKPHTFSINSKTPVTFGVIPNGDIKCYQLEPGEEATSFIKTENGPVSRSEETVSYDTNIFSN